MSSLAASLSYLSRFLQLTDPLKQHLLSQMDRQSIESLNQAIDWMIEHEHAPHSNFEELESWLAPYSKFMSEKEMGVIDGRSWENAQIPGKTWAQFAEENELKISSNSLKDVSKLIQLIRSSPGEKNFEGGS